jgi:hypothetical protein
MVAVARSCVVSLSSGLSIKNKYNKGCASSINGNYVYSALKLHPGVVRSLPRRYLTLGTCTRGRLYTYLLVAPCLDLL